MDTDRDDARPDQAADARDEGGATAATPRVSAWLVVGATTVLGLVDASQVQYDRALQGAPITWPHALIHGLPRWWAWALLVPVVVALARWARARRPGAGEWVVHGLAAPVVTAVQVFLFSTVSTALHGGPELAAHLRPAFLKYVGLTFLSGLVTYAIIVLAWHAARVAAEARRRRAEAADLELRTAELKALLAEARLGRLQHQLQPHFLFNALQTLNGLIESGRRDVAAGMTRRIADFLRRSLSLAGRPEIALREELDLLDDYLEIQRQRYGPRLQVDVEAAPAALGVPVPTLVLQPLVENAIRHGIERRAGAGSIRVDARIVGDDLVVEVLDDGPGPAAGSSSGLGLDNTRARLRELHGPGADLDLGPGPGGRGTRVRVRIPRVEAATP